MTSDISAVIPVYNNPEQTVWAVRSILDQSVQVKEIILVDDRSSAQSFQTLNDSIENLGATVPIHIERLEQNSGPGQARHCGAQLAKGGYVAFLDADDLWHSRKVECVLSVISELNADLIGHARGWCLDASPLDFQPLPDSPKRIELRRIDFFKRNPIPTSSIVVRTELARMMFRFGGRRSEDYMALVLAAMKAQKMAFLKAPLCLARKPPFGVAGEGANQLSIYYASLKAMGFLWARRHISFGQLFVFISFLSIRGPIGMLRYLHYKYRFKSQSLMKAHFDA